MSDDSQRIMAASPLSSSQAPMKTSAPVPRQMGEITTRMPPGEEPICQTRSSDRPRGSAIWRVWRSLTGKGRPLRASAANSWKVHSLAAGSNIRSERAIERMANGVSRRSVTSPLSASFPWKSGGRGACRPNMALR